MNIEGLRDFCLELSNDRPSPGGGAASAAAGAMGASLLIMVCGITSRSKKHAKDKPRLDSLKDDLVRLRDELLLLAQLDAGAYDAVATASKKLRIEDTLETKRAYQDSLRQAVEIPAKTAEACLRVIEGSVEVAKLQTMSASSDSFVAVSLSRAAFEGAAANVAINLREMTDHEFTERTEAEIRVKRGRMEGFVQKALAIIEKPA